MQEKRITDDNQVLEQIIGACKRGSREGFSQIVDLYASRLYGYFYRLTGNAETSNDLLSDVFTKLVEKIGAYGGGSFDLWLFKIAANVFYDHLRFQQRQKRFLEGYKQQLASESDGPKDSDYRAGDILQKQLAQIDEPTREVILLRYYSGLSFKDIAKLRKEPIGTVLSKVHRGLAKLRGLMEQQYEKEKY
jgi:RNA polymerase sigma-70 factor, ECF subfamily